MQTGNLIGGERHEAASGRTFESRNPAHRSEVIGEFPQSSAADVDAAVAAAQRALAGWRATPWPRRGEIVLAAAQIMERSKEELAALMTREMGKVLTEARGDVQEAIDMGKFIAGEGRRAFGETVPSELRNKWAMTMRQPLGVVGCITPWNFPIAIPSWKIFPAVMAGNTVVFKPAEDTPACALRFVEILEEAGLPSGVVNVVFGDHEAGDAVVRHRGTVAIFFTGGAETGRLIAATCGQMLKKVSLELGGKNGIVVLDDADLELAVEGALWGAFGTAGQRCTASSRLIVSAGVLAQFTEDLVARTSALRIGDGLDDAVDVGPVINEMQLARIHGYTEIGAQEGADLLIGGEVARAGDLADGFFYTPTVFGGVAPTMRIAQEEIFGPTTAIIPVGSVDEAIAAANSTQFGLSLSIYTNDLRVAFRAINDLESGIVYVNAPTIGAEIQLPFGGTKNTGNGHREAGGRVLDEFSEPKSIYIDYSGRLQRAQIDTDAT
ncbi:MAG: aldehyde dehydrogenase family protein [Candidatus Dormibacteraeota bacterium]|uniref:Aldehyde dehydrogenase family protein n=1 Tax=Candidatus Amunia macphersoniae TaxID=3127014 RepID=A0A934N9Y5_9BACT|nr:aldehyde dehydrogenase family protein [Candidatus Dormibacteraeota bacterium]